MKRIVLIAVLTGAVSLASYARKNVTEGKTNTAFGDFRIQVDKNPVTINGKEHLPLLISYENSDMEVRLAIDMDRKGKKYYVISDDLSVQYVANRKYFGVEILAPEIEKDGFTTSDGALNRQEYFRQKVITSGQSWRKDQTQLVAAYFSMLIENAEKVLAAK